MDWPSRFAISIGTGNWSSTADPSSEESGSTVTAGASVICAAALAANMPKRRDKVVVVVDFMVLSLKLD